MTRRPMFEVADLTKTYRRRASPANDHINLEIADGEFLGIFGPNGAGKTTLVKQLTGLLRPTSGSIRLDGHDIVANPDCVPRIVGYYGQKVAALRHHTPREVLIFAGCLRGLSRTNAAAQTDELLDRFGMGEYSRRRLSRLSGGEQRLSVLLGTFVGTPRVLILDEPTNELDPVKRRDFWSYLVDYIHRNAATVILTTHNLAEAEAEVGTVAFIDGGRLLAKDTLGALKRRIDTTVTLQIRLRPGHSNDLDHALTRVPGSRSPRTDQWEIPAPRHNADRLLTDILTLVGIDNLDDFRLITPTLEDVYLAFSHPRDGAHHGVLPQALP